MPPIPFTPYPLPADVQAELLALAARGDLLLIGELHGAQEVPRLVFSLLPELARLGYGGLALEAPANQQGLFADYARGQGVLPPFFGPQEFRDGRGSAQALSLLCAAVAAGWDALCFDQAFGLATETWADRDRRMAETLRAQWDAHCPNRKILGICGNYHSRLQPAGVHDLWPSLAFQFQQMRPDLTVRSVNLVFHSGAIFNGDVKSVGTGEPLSEAALRSECAMGHTLALHLPRATPATFFAEV